jgi:Polysaccharide biosynthesis enzyme WcbI
VDHARRAHYADFYDGPPAGGPLALVHGNCQAESLRVLLAGSPTFPYRTVRMPPVHELTAGDLPALHALLPRTALLASQPVRDDYRDLPLGTAQLAARLPTGARVVRWPVIRYAGLTPHAAIVRHPSDMAAVPPVVPYHDLRTLASAAGIRRVADPGPAQLRAAAALSVEELARREELTTDVGVSDVLLGLGVEAAHTVNHPGNPVLRTLARRVQRAAGAPADAADPGRVLLGGIRAPLEAPVLAALGLDAEPRPYWLVDGRPVDDREVREAQLAWYATHPGWVEAGLRRYAERMAVLAFPV